jgi:hypothetical protein
MVRRIIYYLFPMCMLETEHVSLIAGGVHGTAVSLISSGSKPNDHPFCLPVMVPDPEILVNCKLLRL